MRERLPVEDLTPPKPKRSWYGWQTLLADAACIALIVAGGSEDEGGVAIAGLTVFAVASPVVHLANFNTQGAITSLAIRMASVGLLVLGALLTADAFSDDGGDASAPAAVVSVILALTVAASAVVVDASLLAFKEVPPKSRSSEMSFAPMLEPLHGSYGLRFGIKL